MLWNPICVYVCLHNKWVGMRKRDSNVKLAYEYNIFIPSYETLSIHIILVHISNVVFIGYINLKRQGSVISWK